MAKSIPRSQLRAAREAAGLTRPKLAKMAGTTVHYVWTAEMPPYSPMDSNVLNRIVEVVRFGSVAQRESPGSGPHPPAREASWVCPTCGHEEVQPVQVRGVMHNCPKRKKNVSLVRRIS